jgi:hypothetical protein
MKKIKDLKERKLLTSLNTERKSGELKQYIAVTLRTNKNKRPLLEQYYFKAS